MENQKGGEWYSGSLDYLPGRVETVYNEVYIDDHVQIP